MLRKSTDFAGWQTEVEYLAEQAERQKQIEASIALYQREKPGMFVSGWALLKFFGQIVFFGLLGWLLVVGAFSL